MNIAGGVGDSSVAAGSGVVAGLAALVQAAATPASSVGVFGVVLGAVSVDGHLPVIVGPATLAAVSAIGAVNTLLLGDSDGGDKSSCVSLGLHVRDHLLEDDGGVEDPAGAARALIFHAGNGAGGSPVDGLERLQLARLGGEVVLVSELAARALVLAESESVLEFLLGQIGEIVDSELSLRGILAELLDDAGRLEPGGATGTELFAVLVRLVVCGDPVQEVLTVGALLHLSDGDGTEKCECESRLHILVSVVRNFMFVNYQSP